MAKTKFEKKNAVDRKWHVIDLNGKVLGRAATEIAEVLRGKNKASYTPHVDSGDFVLAINAAKIRLTGTNKLNDKTYYRHTGYMGGIKSATAREVLEKHPERLITTAVKGMLPKNDLSRSILKKLKVFAGAEHPHVAQVK